MGIWVKDSKFPGIPAENFREGALQGICHREFPVALVNWQLGTMTHDG